MTLQRRVLATLSVAAFSIVVCVLASIAAAGTAWAAIGPVSILHDGPAADRAEVLEDPTSALTAEQVASHPSFRSIDPAHANHGYTSSTFWIRLTLENPTAEPETAVIELAATPLRAELFNASGTELLGRSGARLPFDARPVRHSNIAFRTMLAARETRTFLIGLASRDTMLVNPVVWREASFWDAVQQRRLLDGIYYGIVLGLALYNLFLAFATRERAYLAYVGFQLAMATANAAIDKYTFQFLWPNSPVWAERSEQALNMLALATAMLCARWLLDTPKIAPKIDGVLRGIMLVAILIGASTTMFDATPLALFSIAAVFFVGITMLVVAASVVARTGSPHGRIFLVAWSVLFAGTFAAGLAAIGGLQSLAGYDLLKIGSALEALLLSIGLAARIRTMQRDRASAQEALLVERARRIESLSRLVAGVAHEIGNPLNFAKGGAGALVSTLEALESVEPATERTKRAATSARRALALVEGGLDRIGRMLKHLRSDLGDRQAHAAEVVVRSELDDALEMLAPWLAERQVIVERDDAVTTLAVHARSGDLAQVFGNLVRNAGEAMSSGGKLYVTSTREKGNVVISFRDEGPGVPADLHGSIFEPFFTTRVATAASSDDDVGTGLGLYVSREIVSRWGGTLSLAPDSQPGATFVVHIPLATEG